MDTIRLRTLSMKSVIGFGQYADLSVSQCLTLGHSGYLQWVYYNCSNISFLPEVLALIYIPENGRIQKPGTDEQRFKIMRDEFSEFLRNRTPLEAKIGNATHKKREAGKYASKMHYQSKGQSKAFLKAKNQMNFSK